MSELRHDLTTGDWVIIATERRKRPSDFVRHHATAPELHSFVSTCPFCPGNEGMTPPATLTLPDPDQGPWRVRVFPNKFAALTPAGDTVRKPSPGGFVKADGLGFHEVIVETPSHNKPIALMSGREIVDILHAYRSRHRELAGNPLVKAVILFKNSGADAGTSLEHPHSQLVATGFVPRHIRVQCDVAINYYDNHGRCLYADLTDREVADGSRIIMETDRFTVFHPFASHRPFETWIMPKAQFPSFKQTTDDEIHGLSLVLQSTLLKIYHGLDNPDYNLVVDSVPVAEELADYYRWHIRIIPRISRLAGFEIGSGMYINTALPEETAEFMRELSV